MLKFFLKETLEGIMSVYKLALREKIQLPRGTHNPLKVRKGRAMITPSISQDWYIDFINIDSDEITASNSTGHSLSFRIRRISGGSHFFIENQKLGVVLYEQKAIKANVTRGGFGSYYFAEAISSEKFGSVNFDQGNSVTINDEKNSLLQLAIEYAQLQSRKMLVSLPEGEVSISSMTLDRIGFWSSSDSDLFIDPTEIDRVRVA